MRSLAGALAVLVAAACGAPADETIVIIRGDDGPWLDLTITGEDLAGADGTPVILQIGMPERPPERLGLGRTSLAGGGFSIRFPEVWEHGLYKRKVVLVDADGDGRCDDGELVVVDLSAAVEDRTLVVRPTETAGLWGDFFPGTCDDVADAWPER